MFQIGSLFYNQTIDVFDINEETRDRIRIVQFILINCNEYWMKFKMDNISHNDAVTSF